MISIRDIAKECGVSVATVSKALNGHHDISAQTRETVCRKAAEMGYQRNSAARALKTNRTYNLGVLYEDPQHSGLGHEYFSRILESFRAQAEACGYDVTFINRNVGKRRSSYLEHCRYRGVDGVCVVCVNFLDPQVLELVQSELPVVTVDHMFNNRTSIVSDNVKGVQTLVNHVFGMGHRNIAFIHGERTAVTESRCASFYKTCYDLGLQVPDAYVREGAYHDCDSCERITAELLALPQRPTCIFFTDDVSALGGFAAIARAGLRVPEDISAVGYDGIPLAKMMIPSLTTYHQDTQAIGYWAADRLVSLIEHPKTTLPESILIPGSLLEGASVRRI